MHCQISPRKTCNPCGCTMKISSRCHRLLFYEVKRTTRIDGMGPFNNVSVIANFIPKLQKQNMTPPNMRHVLNDWIIFNYNNFFIKFMRSLILFAQKVDWISIACLPSCLS